MCIALKNPTEVREWESEWMSEWMNAHIGRRTETCIDRENILLPSIDLYYVTLPPCHSSPLPKNIEMRKSCYVVGSTMNEEN